MTAPPPPGDFAEVLAEQTLDPSPLAEAYDFVRRNAAVADNVGVTGDERDFYTHLDALSAGVAATFPQSLCKAGCSACCHYPVALFTLSFTEWQIMRRHMETVWTEAERAAFIQRYRAVFNGFWRFVLGFLQHSLLGLVATAPLVMSRRIACPFLKDDQCSIYAARPYQCRTFGYFAARTWPARNPKVYACNMQGETLLTLLARNGPQFQLPVMNPLVLKIRKLCKGPRMALPLWAGIWVDRQEKRARALSAVDADMGE